jgi:hypothetical protein
LVEAAVLCFKCTGQTMVVAVYDSVFVCDGLRVQRRQCSEMDTVVIFGMTLRRIQLYACELYRSRACSVYHKQPGDCKEGRRTLCWRCDEKKLV